MSSTPIDFKEQMVEARRTQILMGAAEVFAEKGFHKATTREIAKRAGVSEGTIYNYFDNKRELLLALIELLGLRSLKHIIGGELPDDPRELFKAVANDRYKLIEERGYLIAPIIAEIFVDAELRALVYQKLLLSISSYLEKYVQTQIDAGRFRQMDPIIVTRAFIGMMAINYALKLADVDPRYEKISAQSLNQQLVSLMLDGLLSDETRNKENGATQAEK